MRDTANPSSEPREGPGGGLAHDGRSETSHERLDRNLEELTGEMRVAVTGVQVLFAFLLVVPFDTRFGRLGPFERGVYFATLLLAAAAAACVIAPSAHHRILFRHDDKSYLVATGTRIALAGLGFLALAMCGALLLVASLLFGAPLGIATAALAAVAFGVLWFALPLRRARLRRRERHDRSAAGPGQA